jgi:hypothetical protein
MLIGDRAFPQREGISDPVGKQGTCMRWISKRWTAERKIPTQEEAGHTDDDG